ncbi:MAG TPA: hypothetical protein VMF91_00710 [Bryobacteraceae bacterium]|nr:hypothetical protein [Bryobacteraceae bacterium]
MRTTTSASIGAALLFIEFLVPNSRTAAAATLCCTNVVTYHNDAQRTGWNSTETVLTPATVTAATFGAVATTNLDDQVDAQPLVVTNQAISGNGTHTVVYVATEHNTVYAIDGSTGAVLLSRNLGAPVSSPQNCRLNGPNVGINGTPVIDVSQNAMFVITYTSAGGPTYTIHKLDLTTLADDVTPVVVSASHTLNDGTTLSFDPAYERQRPALLEANGNIYAGFGALCQSSVVVTKARGWVLGWNATSLAPLPANELTDSQATSPGPFFMSSVWMSGYGISADSLGGVYFVTGDSNNVHSTPPPPNTYDGVTNIQESVVQMQSDLSAVTDLFTPNNVFTLDQGDLDFGSGGVMVLPDQPAPFPHLAVAAGKDGRNFIMNRDSMGGYQTPDVPNNVPISGCWCGPSYFQGSDGVGRVVTSGGTNVETWKVDNTGAKPNLDLEATGPSIPAGILLSTGGGQRPGFFTSISSNGTLPNSSIIWAIGRPTGGTEYVTLYAYNATASGSAISQLWSGPAGTWPNSGTAAAALTLSGSANLVPTVANGMVYVASYQQLWIFGLKTVGSPTPWVVVNDASNSLSPGVGLAIPATGSGNLVATAISFNGTTSVTGVTDNAGNAYVSAGARATNGVLSSEIWYVAHSLPGATKITPQFAGSPTTIEMSSWEVSGLTGANIDAKNTTSGNVTATNTGGAPVTTTHAGDFIASTLYANVANFTNIINGNEFTNDFFTGGDGWAQITGNNPIVGTHQANWFTSAPGGIYASSTVAFCSCPVAPPQPWTLVKKASSTLSPGSGLTISASGSGNMIAVAINFNGTTSVTGVTDNAGNTYVSAGARATYGPLSSEIWYAVHSKSGATLVTPHFGGSPTTIEMSSWEVSGLSTAAPDAAKTASGTVTANTAGAAVTTTQAGDFVVSVLFANAATFSRITTGNEFTADFTTGGDGWAHITSNSAAAGSHQASWFTASPTGIYCASTAAFRTGP